MNGARDPLTGLTLQQEAFAQRVAAGDSQAEAYRTTYPRSRRWKSTAVHEQASRLAATPKVAARIGVLVAQIRERAVERLAIDRAKTLDEIARVAFSDVGNLFDDAGHLHDLHTLTPAERASIAAFEIEHRRVPIGDSVVDEYRVIKVRLWNKVDSLEKLAKHLGLFSEHNRQLRSGLLDHLPRDVLLQVMAVIDKLSAEVDERAAKTH